MEPFKFDYLDLDRSWIPRKESVPHGGLFFSKPCVSTSVKYFQCIFDRTVSRLSYLVILLRLLSYWWQTRLLWKALAGISEFHSRLRNSTYCYWFAIYWHVLPPIVDEVRR
jgi:hypothetical protein